ncbi:MAG TPA: protein kinase [Terriglobales bacterium]|nr:protein kinase [Terriglobales bacterium]
MSLLTTVGRYEITGELGRGAMGVVYKAKDPTIGRTVALKTMRLDVHGLESAEMVRRFQNEARAAGLLSHPNIVTIYDAGEQDGIFYIAMEFIQGTTLHELLTEQHILAADDIVQYSRQICRGLDYAHSHGIVHRDVKPANIMITANGMVKIMDFGIAKAGGSVTSTGQVLGTPNYMAPEQVKGKPLDGRSDLFSFGVILYEMLTGEKPFVGQNVTTIIYKIVNENPITPRDLDVTVHPGLSSIVTKALAKSPEDRYQSGAELIHDLENYKTAGAQMHATSVLPAYSAPPPSNGKSAATSVIASAADKTVVLPVKVVSGSTVRTAAATAPARVPARRPMPVLRKPKINVPNFRVPFGRKKFIPGTILAVLLLGSLMGGLAYQRTRTQMRQLETAVKSQAEAQREEALRQQQDVLPSIVNPKPDVNIAPDTTIKFFKPQPAAPHPQNNAHLGAPATPNAAQPRKATSSPNQVYTQQSEIKFTSTPDGAKVEIDGWSEPNWVTPFTASNLAAGFHLVSFTKAGYLTQSRGVDTAAGKSLQMAADLAPAVSTIVVSSNPQGANIWLDGKDSSLVTPAQLTVEKGPHRLVVRKAGFRDAAADENLSEGQTISFTPVLLSQGQRAEDGASNNLLHRLFGAETVPEGKGLVHVRTEPEGATIIVDGRVAPKKSNARWPADPGVYSIVVEMDGYKPVHRNIRVQKGKIINLDEILEKQ